MQLFVFDLDFTLWDAGGLWCDCTTPPFIKHNNDILDAKGNKIVLYNNVEKLLESIKSSGKKLGIASRTSAPHIANELLELFNLRRYFDFIEIFPAEKTKHFQNIKDKSGIRFDDMVFFDDEYRNIIDVLQLGVQCELVDGGIDWKLIEHKYLRAEFKSLITD